MWGRHRLEIEVKRSFNFKYGSDEWGHEVKTEWKWSRQRVKQRSNSNRFGQSLGKWILVNTHHNASVAYLVVFYFLFLFTEFKQILAWDKWLWQCHLWIDFPHTQQTMPWDRETLNTRATFVTDCSWLLIKCGQVWRTTLTGTVMEVKT